MNESRPKSSSFFLTTKRVETLTDGVFAIAMTLLVLNLRIPTIPEEVSNKLLPEVLSKMSPHFYAYVISFLLLAVFWTIHHKQFHSIKKVNEPLLWINVIFLMFVVLIPFSASLKGEYEDLLLTAIIFHGNMLAVGLLLYFQYWYATDKHRLISPDTDDHLIDVSRKRNLLIPATSAVAIAISFVGPEWSGLTYLSIPFILARFLKH